jgi:transposase
MQRTCGGVRATGATPGHILFIPTYLREYIPIKAMEKSIRIRALLIYLQSIPFEELRNETPTG